MPDAQREALKKKFKKMMGALYKQEGAMMEVEILKDKEVLDFIDTHASILDSTFEKVKMSDTMRSSLQQSNWVFSGMKTFHELKEAFPSLLDENGEKKPFERFLKDVQRVDETYNRNYLRAEYNFVSSSAEMAARWEEFEKDGDRYFLQYRTVGDDRVRKEHAALDATTLPVEHPFWDTHYPPNGWNCRCNVVQVRKSRYPATSEDELIERKKALAEEQARHKGKSEMFRFNPGKQRKTFPDYNPYTIKRCGDCDIAKGRMAKEPLNEICAACALARKCERQRFEVIKRYPNGGSIHKHHLVKEEDSDYQKLLDVANFFAAQGKEVKLTPKKTHRQEFVYENIYSSLLNTRYEGKCPDFLIDGVWYEHEGFISLKPKNAFRNMMNDGLLQSSRLIIDRPDLTTRFMKRSIMNRIADGAVIDEVWLRESEGVFTLLYKKTDG